MSHSPRGSSRPLALNAENITEILDSVENGNMQGSRNILAVEFKMNDIIAETSLSHLSEELKKQSFKPTVLEMFKQPLEYQQSIEIINKVFGLYGKAAQGVLQNLGLTDKKS